MYSPKGRREGLFMKNYDNTDNIRVREQIVEVTLQREEFKGTLKTTVTGRRFGLNIIKGLMDVNDIFDISDWEQSGCTITDLGEDDEGQEWFKYVLTREDGETMEGEDFWTSFADLVVGINIVDCKVIKR